MERSQIKLTQSNRKKKKQTTIPTTGYRERKTIIPTISTNGINWAWLFLGTLFFHVSEPRAASAAVVPADTADSGCRGVDSGVAGVVTPPGELGPGVEGTRMVAWKAFFKAMVGKGFIQLLEMWVNLFEWSFCLISYLYIYISVILDVIHVHPCWEQYWCTSKK